MRGNENRYEKLGGSRNLRLKLKLCSTEWETTLASVLHCITFSTKQIRTEISEMTYLLPCVLFNVLVYYAKSAHF